MHAGKGDDGTSTTLHHPSRKPKSNIVFDTIGSLDELNSFIGLVKTEYPVELTERDYAEWKLLEQIQKNLFIIQGEIGGAIGEEINEGHLCELEEKIKELSVPVKSFVIPGGSKLSAWYDVLRTVCRRAERYVVRAKEMELHVGEYTLAYLNRLSSLFFGLARYHNAVQG